MKSLLIILTVSIALFSCSNKSATTLKGNVIEVSGASDNKSGDTICVANTQLMESWHKAEYMMPDTVIYKDGRFVEFQRVIIK